MAEYIDRKVAIERFQKIKESGVSFKDAIYLDGVMAVLENLPSADVAPIVRAKWVEYENEQDRGFHYCSNCKGQAFNYDDGNEVVEVLAPNCHNCGAKMDL